MEPVGIALVISLLFGGWNWVAKESAQAEVERLNDEIQIIVEVNEHNGDTILSLEASLSTCNAERLRTISEINRFREIEATQENAIQVVLDHVRDSDFAECVVPDGVSLRGIEDPS